MKSILKFIILILVITSVAACNTSKNPFFRKRSPHEKYGDNLKEAGLQQTQLGMLWFTAANTTLEHPQPVKLPYKEIGYFAAERPGATSYSFKVQRGEKVQVSVSTIPSNAVICFTELWELDNGNTSLLTILDTLSHKMEYNVKKNGELIIRLQPELLRSFEYTLTITTAPSLAFPVDSSGNPGFISFWGAGRDAGARKHEGVDIQAKFRTPALAATNGIAKVSENNLGGKVVFIYDASGGNSFYYAHLDSQIVHTGESSIDRPGDWTCWQNRQCHQYSATSSFWHLHR